MISSLNTKKWSYFLDGGDYDFQDGKLLLTTGNPSDSAARLYSNWRFPGNFDMQVDFQQGENWNFPPASHLDNAALGVVVDNHIYHIVHIMRSDQEGGTRVIMLAWNDLPDVYYHTEKATQAVSGSLRLIRVGGLLIYLYDDGNGWIELDRVNLPTAPAQAYLDIQSVNVSQVFSTFFSNFKINSGWTIP